MAVAAVVDSARALRLLSTELRSKAASNRSAADHREATGLRRRLLQGTTAHRRLLRAAMALREAPSAAAANNSNSAEDHHRIMDRLRRLHRRTALRLATR